MRTMPVRPATPRRAAPAALGLLAILLLGMPTAAQEVRGRFLASPGDRPLAGALLTLVNGGGVELASTLSNAAGWFSLKAPAAGGYTLRAEHIGYATQVKQVEVSVGSVTWVELRSTFQAIELEGLTAEVDKACELPAATAARLAVLWDEVGKALRVTRYVEEQGTYLFDVEKWTRSLEPERLRVQEERRRPRAGMHAGSPFVSLPPERLASEGYILGEAGTEEIAYYGPDARVLVDPSFQRSHCFALVARGPEPGWIGLGFTPRDKRARDVEGTLWIDRDSYEPQRLDYRYSVLPWPLVTDKVGGRVEFTRLPQGPWIVQRWYIRMPVVTEQSFRMGTFERRYMLASVVEEGGQVLKAEAGEVAFATTLSVVEGTVVRTPDRAPVEGSVVRIEGTFLQDTTDARGRFRIPGVPEGRYLLNAGTPALRVLGFSGSETEVDVAGTSVTGVEIALPTESAVVAGQCRAPLTEEGAGVLVGKVLDPKGAPFPGGTVQVMWYHVNSGKGGVSYDRESHLVPTMTIDQDQMIGSVPVESDGRFAVCGAPEDIHLTLTATAPGFMGTPVVVGPLFEELGHAELTLEPVEVAEALVVHVTTPDGRTPLEAARVELPALGRSVATDASGTATFTQIPVGPHAMTVSHMAYMSRTDSLVVAPEGRTVVRLELADRALELEPIVVEVRTPETVAERRRAASGSISVAQPRIRELIRTARADNVVDVVRATLPTGVRISPMVRGSNYVGTCIESTRGGAQFRKIKEGPRVCLMVQVVLDGGYLTTDEAARLVESFPLLDIVSIEFLSPMDQTFRYGTQNATGMLIIRTAR